MERPPKRPRLSIFRDSPAGADLTTDRHSNDLALKGRFESIFAKYSQDFSNIGDEIDLMSGEIVVNNGHLESMETETDHGISHLTGEFAYTGRSMLRAMTVALDSDIPGPDDVLMSIEAIAENATYSDDISSSESDDDLFRQAQISSVSRSMTRAHEVGESCLNEGRDQFNSESHSLFDEEKEQRSSSDDSLFGCNQNYHSLGRLTNETSSGSADTKTSPTITGTDDETIIAKFGPTVGKEVLQLIDQRQDAHLEPAWRIPVKLNEAPARVTTSYLTHASARDDSPEGRQKISLWDPPPSKRQQRLTPEGSGRMLNTREESIDPLQENIANPLDASQSLQSKTKHQYLESNSTSLLASENEFIQDILDEISTTNACPYCGQDFSRRIIVFDHWDRILRHFENEDIEDGVHNYQMMRKIRSKATKRICPSRMALREFRTIIELHEGAGLSFDEIVDLKAVRTRKNGSQLQETYSQIRGSADLKKLSSAYRPWSEDEDETLRNMCEDPLLNIAALRRGFKNRDEKEIINHLAEIWLNQFDMLSKKSEQHSRRDTRHNVLSPKAINSSNRSTSRMGSQGSTPLKQESDDELFGWKESVHRSSCM